MTRSASAALMPLREARALLLDGVGPVASSKLALPSAIGLVSAVDVMAAADLPPRCVALRDGWAVEAALVTGASPYAPVQLLRAPPWTESGDQLPEGTDAVLPPEALTGLEVTGDIGSLDGTRAAGEDLRCGERLLTAGERLTPLKFLGLAAAGVSSIGVRRPRVLLVVTSALSSAATDALSPMLQAMIVADGALADAIAVSNDAKEIAAVLTDALADAVFIIGGSGFGRSDRSAEGLALAGDVRAHGIALRPGESAAFGTAAGRPVLLLPGRPEAAVAVFITLGRPLIAMLAGACETTPERAPLSAKIVSTIGLSEIVFVRLLQGAVLPLGGQDLSLRALLGAAGAVLVDPEREGYPEGAQIEVLPL